MSKIIAKNIQIGNSNTTSQNFTLSVPSVQDGTIKLSRGNAGATISDILSIDGSGNVKTTSSFQDIAGNNISAFGNFKNKIINGNFDIWQRGTTLTQSVNNSYFIADRWLWNPGGGATTCSQQAFTIGQTSVPNEPSYFYRYNITGTPSGTPSLEQRIENVRTLAGKNATFSFWAKADTSRTVTVGVHQQFGTGGSVAVVGLTSSINLTTSWQKFTISGTMPSISGKTLGTGHFVQAVFIFPIATGTFDIAQVQLEEGSVATPFEDRPIGAELALCQRYYELVSGTSVTTRPLYTVYPYKVTKRNTGTASLFSGSLSSADYIAWTDSALRSPNSVAATGAADWVIAVNAEL